MKRNLQYFKPSDLPNLAAWFRFGLGITAVSGAISQWDDASGNARHLIQATGANQPTLQNTGAVLFDGVAQYLKCASFTLTQPETVYALMKSVTFPAGTYNFDGNTANTGALRSLGGGTSLGLNAGAGLTGPVYVGGVYNVVSAVFNGASSVVQLDYRAPTTGNAGASNMSGFTLGARGDGAVSTNIEVKEVVILSAAHDALTRALVISYLARVGGLAI